MAESAFPLGKNEYITEKPVQMWLGTRTSGVWSGNDNLRVEADNGMTVKVYDGLAWMNFAKYRGIMYGNTDSKKIAIPASDGVLKRIDRIVVQFDIINNNVRVINKVGTFTSSTPKAKILQRDKDVYEIALADIYVGPGVDKITPANITDTRLDPNLCGLMRDGVDGIPSEGLWQQWSDWLENLKKSIYDLKVEWDKQFASQGTQWQNQMNKQDSDYKAFMRDTEVWLSTVKIDLPKYANFDFDNLAPYIGAQADTEFLSNGNIKETLKNKLNNVLVAERLTEFLSDGSIKSTETVYQTDGKSILRKSTKVTTFNGNKITEVIS